jgi:5-methylcytosine-specific restriction endonuclease McrA
VTPEAKRGYNRAYGVAHREEIHRVAAAGRRRDRVKSAARMALWRAAHKVEKAAYAVAWRAANPEKAREADARNSARRRGASVCDHLACLILGPTQLAWQTSEHCCYLCGTPLQQGAKPGEPGHVHLDHVIPVARGGLHCAANLRPACASCNQRKYVKPLSTLTPVLAGLTMTAMQQTDRGS